MTRTFMIVLFVLLPGCPIRVDPPTGAACSAKPNCGQCAALEPCVWCPSANDALRGCYAEASTTLNCDVPMIGVVEACSETAAESEQ